MSWKCEICEEQNDDLHPECWKCKMEAEKIGSVDSPIGGSEWRAIEKLCSTTPSVPGREIAEPLGIVCGEAIMGANIVRDIVAGITNIVGGRSGVYESKVQEGRVIAIREMVKDAEALGADAVVGVDIDYENIAQAMLMICASGTAVKLVAPSAPEDEG